MATRYCTLTDTACINVHGADAGTFLHAQLSRALTSLATDEAPLAAWHDARGRVRALFRVHRLADRWLLVTPRSEAEALLKKLRLFVLRSAVMLDLVVEPSVVAILDATPTWLDATGIDPNLPPNRSSARGELRCARIGGNLWQALGPKDSVAELTASLTQASLADVAAAEIALGIPAITAELAERFVAQMLNLAELGALSFDKGCYPGQEVIARVHNLGGVKRRARRYFAATSSLSVGTPVAANGTDVGEVVRSAATTEGCELLAVVDNAAADAALTCAGVPLAARPLPFVVPRA